MILQCFSLLSERSQAQKATCDIYLYNILEEAKQRERLVVAWGQMGKEGDHKGT